MDLDMTGRRTRRDLLLPKRPSPHTPTYHLATHIRTLPLHPHHAPTFSPHFAHMCCSMHTIFFPFPPPFPSLPLPSHTLICLSYHPLPAHFCCLCHCHCCTLFPFFFFLLLSIKHSCIYMFLWEEGPDWAFPSLPPPPSSFVCVSPHICTSLIFLLRLPMPCLTIFTAVSCSLSWTCLRHATCGMTWAGTETELLGLGLDGRHDDLACCRHTHFS